MHLSTKALLGLALSFFVSSGLALGAPGGVFRYANGSEPKDIDPHLIEGDVEHHITHALFEGLMEKDPKTAKPIPGMAEKHTVSKDGKKYVFFLRKDAKWTNGDPVTAADFVYGWQRALKPETGSTFASYLFVVKGARELNAGTVKDPATLGIKAVNPHQLEVELLGPTPYFLGLVARPIAHPVHKATVEKHGRKWTLPANIVSNGTFTLEKWEIGRVLRVKKNPAHYRASSVQLDAVEFLPIESVQTAENMFRSGQVDGTLGMPAERYDYWRKEKSGAYHSDPVFSTYYYQINVTKPPLNNKKVRQALALAVDRKRLTEFVTRAGEPPLMNVSPPGIGGFYPKPGVPADGSGLAKAKALLLEAGYPGGKGLKFEVIYNTDERHKKLAEALQQMWKTNLGAEVTIVNQEWKVYLTNMSQKNYQVARAAWGADYNDPLCYLDMFESTSQNNRSGYNDPKFDKLLNEARMEANPKRRLDFYNKLENHLMEDMPIIPLFIYTRNYLLNPKVQGWTPNLEDYHPVWALSFK